MEIWRAIPKHPVYEVSSLGRVRNSTDGHVLSPNYKDKGYAVVRLSGKKRKAQHLVLEAFVGPKPEGWMCRHLNGVKADNRLENLVWGTAQENTADAFVHGTVKRKLAPIHIAEITRLHLEGVSRNALADRFGVAPKTIDWHLCVGKYIDRRKW